MRVWYVIIYLVFGVSLIFLSLALYERLKAGSPALAQAVTTFGLIYAVLVIVVGTLEISNLSIVVKLYGENPAQAATVWLTLDSVATGLGGGGGETMVNALWFLLLSCVALRARELPRVLNYLGLVVGVAGILTVLLASLLLMAVFMDWVLSSGSLGSGSSCCAGALSRRRKNPPQNNNLFDFQAQRQVEVLERVLVPADA